MIPGISLKYQWKYLVNTCDPIHGILLLFLCKIKTCSSIFANVDFELVSIKKLWIFEKSYVFDIMCSISWTKYYKCSFSFMFATSFQCVSRARAEKIVSHFDGFPQWIRSNNNLFLIRYFLLNRNSHNAFHLNYTESVIRLLVYSPFSPFRFCMKIFMYSAEKSKINIISLNLHAHNQMKSSILVLPRLQHLKCKQKIIYICISIMKKDFWIEIWPHSKHRTFYH